MTPINLDDVEDYLIGQLPRTVVKYNIRVSRKWIRARFAELRAGEESKGRG